ncbi:MAG: hydroxyacid dehydrogenase [Bdellovibrionales bacterium RIFCSPHIGHO2_01_FULL_40_29]|nr:MAG: hydroxyacid dehydrogenase [Bdellovibrionales bacterium RIFCSPHIGHO2_01_FULL_40_29]OFZ34871.1 MAG: hydroxyacid dehydrogenase [Bdellovibrionales bacterium RIFCSPHIGHO2_02_FULL_40_15]
MKIAFFDTHGFEKPIFQKENEKFQHEISFFETRLTEQTANLAANYSCVCAFVNDGLDKKTLQVLSTGKTRLIALRSAGFNHVDLASARALGFRVVRVPEYSPYAVAEHAMALILSLNRKIHRAYNRVREGNFSLDGLVGFDLNKKTVGVIGTGRIGSVMAKILVGFGCHVVAYDSVQNLTLQKLGVQYTSLDELLQKSDIISLHVPLTPKTRHLIDERALALTKPGVMLINTGRGALIDTHALIASLKSEHVGYAGLDVYEEEEGLFFEDFSEKILQDDQLARLLTFPNVLLTSHQAFLTKEALENIAQVTLQNISEFENKTDLSNEIGLERT